MIKNKTEIHIFDKTTIDDLKWPDNPQARTAKSYLLPLIRQGVKKYIKNTGTRMLVLKIDDMVLPVTICDKPDYEDSFIASPYSHYISYVREEISRLKKPGIKIVLDPFLVILGTLFKRLQIDKAVIINNWLFPTIIYPNFTKCQLKAITKYMAAMYPRHVILFRCISFSLTGQLMDLLTENKYQMIVSRSIYLVETKNRICFKKRDAKRDIKLLQNSGYPELAKQNFSVGDTDRIAELYRGLYIDKYTRLNPMYTKAFINLTFKENTFAYRILRIKGRVKGFVAFFQKNGIMASAMAGYDFAIPQKIGLYRMLMAVCLNEAHRYGGILNWSSGAAEFKCLRGAVPDLEYYAAYHKHLPFWRCLPWYILAFIFNRISEFLMKKQRRLTTDNTKEKHFRQTFIVILKKYVRQFRRLLS